MQVHTHKDTAYKHSGHTHECRCTHTRTQPTSTVDTHMNAGAHTHKDTV